MLSRHSDCSKPWHSSDTHRWTEHFEAATLADCVMKVNDPRSLTVNVQFAPECSPAYRTQCCYAHSTGTWRHRIPCQAVSTRAGCQLNRVLRLCTLIHVQQPSAAAYRYKLLTGAISNCTDRLILNSALRLSLRRIIQGTIWIPVLKQPAAIAAPHLEQNQ